MLLDMKVYKLSKIASKDIPEAIKRLGTAIEVLSPYRRYKAIGNSIIVLINNRDVLKEQLKLFERALKDKGRVK